MPFTPCSICSSRESLLKPLKAQCSFQVWKFVNLVNNVPYFLDVLSQKLASHFSIKEEDLRSPVKKKAVSEAKAAFGCLAIKKMGYSGREVGRFLNMRSYSAIRRSEEGEKILDKRGFVWDLAQE